jgi:hypothetical protein
MAPWTKRRPNDAADVALDIKVPASFVRAKAVAGCGVAACGERGSEDVIRG